MKAIIQRGYGDPHDVLELRDVDLPKVGDDEVLVRVRAASLHPDVWHVVTGVPYVLRAMGAGLVRPRNRIPGIDLAGRVESIGRNVTRFRPGDDVFGEIVRGHQWLNAGAFAEYASAPADSLVPKPARLTFEQAAAAPTAGLIALQMVLDEGRVRAGQRVLVNGAGGGVGTFALQIAKALGATVTGVDRADKLEAMRALGADRVIDYATEDFTRSGERHDVIIDIPGTRSFEDLKRALAPDGVYVLVGHDLFGSAERRWIGGIGQFARLALTAPFGRTRREPRPKESRAERLAMLAALMDDGKVTPFVDRAFPLNEFQDAFRYMESGSVRGKIVLTMPAA